MIQIEKLKGSNIFIVVDNIEGLFYGFFHSRNEAMRMTMFPMTVNRNHIYL